MTPPSRNPTRRRRRYTAFGHAVEHPVGDRGDGPPEHAGISRCFDTMAKAIARRGAIATDIRPLALTWKQDSTAELLLRDENTRRCHLIELTVPTDADLASGTYLLSGGLGGPPTRLTSPVQYAAGEIARLRDYGRSGIELWGQDTRCP